MSPRSKTLMCKQSLSKRPMRGSIIVGQNESASTTSRGTRVQRESTRAAVYGGPLLLNVLQAIDGAQQRRVPAFDSGGGRQGGCGFYGILRTISSTSFEMESGRKGWDGWGGAVFCIKVNLFKL